MPLKILNLLKCANIWLLLVCSWLSFYFACASDHCTNKSCEHLERNVSCTFSTSKRKQVLTLDISNPQILSVDTGISNLTAKIECTVNLGKNRHVANGKLFFRVKRDRKRIGQEVAGFVENSKHALTASLDIGKYFSTNFEELAYVLDINMFNKTKTIARGHLNIEIKHNFLKIEPQMKMMNLNHTCDNWRILSSSCNLDSVYILPSDLSSEIYRKTGLPIAVGKGKQNISIVKWEHIFFQWTSNESKSTQVEMANRSLFFYSKNYIFLVEDITNTSNGNKTRDIKNELSMQWQISEILSISYLENCSVIKDHWFTTAVLFRYPNTSIGVILSYYPYITWYAYRLPDWLKPGTYFQTTLVETRALIILLQLKEPLITMITLFHIPQNENILRLVKAPFIFEISLKKPRIKLMNMISSLLVHDDKEVWISATEILSFEKIFSTKHTIHGVVDVGKRRTDLAIITSRQIFMYSSNGLKSFKTTKANCSENTTILCKVNEQGRIEIYCNNRTIPETMHFKSASFTPWQRIIPAFTAMMHNGFEIEMILPSHYQHFPELFVNWRNLCFVAKYPNLYLCKGKDGSSLLVMSTNGIIYTKMLMESAFVFQRVNASMYLITARHDNLFTEEMIGQTFQVLDPKVSCWVYWLLNENTAQAICYQDRFLGDEKRLESSKVVLVDSKGSERCYKINVTLNSTDTTLLYHLHVNFTSIDQQNHLEISSYARLSDTIGELIKANGSRFLKPKYPVIEHTFTYICLLSEDTQYGEVADQVSTYAQICHFDIVYDNLPEEYVFLDMNDKLVFNVTLKKLKTGVPYWDLRPPVTIKLSNIQQILMQVNSYMKDGNRQIHVLLTQKPNVQGTTVLNIHTTTQSKHCNNSMKKIIIYGTCPPEKTLIFQYPMVFSKQTWMNENPKNSEGMMRIATIPYNYQPQSKRGKAIPMTRHIYNADPSKPMNRARYKITRDMAEFKQCKGKLNRLACECSDEMTYSSLPEHSDCIQRVYNVDFHETIQPRLFVSEGGITTTTLKFPYYVTEINGRQDYSITKAVDGDRMSVLANSSLKFSASGLYHFKVTVVKSGYTFCNLETYFVVFVAHAPLPHPAQDLVRAMTAFCFGSILLTVFLLKYHTNI